MGVDWISWLWWTGLIIGLALLLVVGTTWYMVLALSKSRLVPLAREEAQAEPRTHAAEGSHRWAEENGFSFVGYFLFTPGSALVAAWQRADRATFFCQYVTSDKSIFDFVTLFAGDVALTTGSSGGAQIFPLRPGYYMQSFSGLSLEEQWARHVEMEKYLTEIGRAWPARAEMPFEQCFLDYTRKQIAYVRGLLLWPLRGIYWHFLRRRLWHNLSIRQQHERGRIRMPHELTPGEIA